MITATGTIRIFNHKGEIKRVNLEEYERIKNEVDLLCTETGKDGTKYIVEYK